MNCAIYTRVSTNNQTEKGFSSCEALNPATLEQILTDKAKEKSILS